MTTTPERMVRLLLNDVAEPYAFTGAEIADLLALEGGSVKRAAAQGLDTIADNEALTLKVIRDHNLSTDGAKVADSLRKRAAELRRQADDEDDRADDDGAYFDVIDHPSASRPELTGW